MSEDAEIRGVIPTYYSFIVEKLNRIYDAWDKNQTVNALFRTIKLTNFLPLKLKKQIYEETGRIKKRLEQEAQVKSFTYEPLVFSWKTKLIADEELENFVDRVTSLLDQEHLLTEKYGVPTKARSMKDLQMTVDRAQYERSKQEAE